MRSVDDVLVFLGVSSGRCEGWGIGGEGWDISERIAFDIASDPESAREFGFDWSDLKCDQFVLFASIYGERSPGVPELDRESIVRRTRIREKDGMHRGEIEIA